MHTELAQVFIVALLAGVAGNELGHRHKKVVRSTKAKFVIGVCSGFGAALLTLIVLSAFESAPSLVALFVGIFYGYLMTNAKYFSGIE